MKKNNKAVAEEKAFWEANKPLPDADELEKTMHDYFSNFNIERVRKYGKR